MSVALPEWATAEPAPPALSIVEPPVATSQWGVWGTTVSLSVQPASALPEAREIVRRELAAMDRAANRFEPGSELSRLPWAGGRPVRVTPLFLEALETALAAAEATDGAVDPTVGGALIALGYDRDYDEVAAGLPSRPLNGLPLPAPGWRSVVLDRRERTVTLRHGVHLDLGATAKALTCDRAAAAVARVTGAGTLLSIGGDVAVAGPVPEQGWPVAVAADARLAPVDEGCTVAVFSGGLASSGTTARSWWRDNWPLHDIVDPRTGWPARPVWRLVTVAARTCVEANAASTAAVVWGDEAPERLDRFGLPARLVAADGEVLELGDWPRPTV